MFGINGTRFQHLDKNALFDVTLAANYLDIKMLLEYCCKTVSDLIKVRIGRVYSYRAPPRHTKGELEVTR